MTTSLKWISLTLIGTLVSITGFAAENFSFFANSKLSANYSNRDTQGYTLARNTILAQEIEMGSEIYKKWTASYTGNIVKTQKSNAVSLGSHAFYNGYQFFKNDIITAIFEFASIVPGSLEMEKTKHISALSATTGKTVKNRHGSFAANFEAGVSNEVPAIGIRERDFTTYTAGMGIYLSYSIPELVKNLSNKTVHNQGYASKKFSDLKRSYSITNVTGYAITKNWNLGNELTVAFDEKHQFNGFDEGKSGINEYIYLTYSF